MNIKYINNTILNVKDYINNSVKKFNNFLNYSNELIVTINLIIYWKIILKY